MLSSPSGTSSIGRVGDVVVREDNSQNRGYVKTVAHLVKVEEID